VIALMAGLALVLVLVPRVWPVTRMLVTITHMGAHAVAAVCAGRRLQGIRQHSDTSGLTVSSGRPSGPGMVVMLAAGYLGRALVHEPRQRPEDERRPAPSIALPQGRLCR
jgi:hypothetical protein